jgi:hypothetical protein
VSIVYTRQTVRWVDDTTCFYVNTSIYMENGVNLYFLSQRSLYEAMCLAVVFNEPGAFYHGRCSENVCTTFLCEAKPKNLTTTTPQNPPVTLQQNVGLPEWKYEASRFVMCPAGHVTHSFLSCDPRSHCGVSKDVSRCEVYMTDDGATLGPWYAAQGSSGSLEHVSAEMFKCHKHGETVPYTLVCDFRPDCLDQSDELDCEHVEYHHQYR